MLQAIAQSIDGTALSWAAGCCLVAGAAYTMLRKNLEFRTRFEASVRVVEAAQGAYVGLSAARHLLIQGCLLYTSPSPRDMRRSRMPSSA